MCAMARPRKPLLSRDRIVGTAGALVDAEGLAALSTRRLAAELGVSGPSLYNHFRTKDEILDAVADAVSAKIDLSMFAADDTATGGRRCTTGRSPTAPPSPTTRTSSRSSPRAPAAARPACGSPTPSSARWSARAGPRPRPRTSAPSCGTSSPAPPSAPSPAASSTTRRRTTPPSTPTSARPTCSRSARRQVDEGAFETGLRALLDGLAAQYASRTAGPGDAPGPRDAPGSRDTSGPRDAPGPHDVPGPHDPSAAAEG